MEDMERYGDYNELDDERPKRPFGFVKILGILLGVVILAVLALLGYRLRLFDYYPDTIRKIAYTERLAAYYAETNGDIGAKTQKLRFPYDDCDIETQNKNDLGSFFSDYLILIPEINELQISTRMNVSALTTIAEKYGIDPLDPDNIDYFSFQLTDNLGRVYDNLVLERQDSHAMYRYFKLVFDDVDIRNPEDGLGAPEWIRLEITLKGQSEPYSYTLIYENNEAFHYVIDYKLTKGEEPK